MCVKVREVLPWKWMGTVSSRARGRPVDRFSLSGTGPSLLAWGHLVLNEATWPGDRGRLWEGKRKRSAQIEEKKCAPPLPSSILQRWIWISWGRNKAKPTRYYKASALSNPRRQCSTIPQLGGGGQPALTPLLQGKPMAPAFAVASSEGQEQLLVERAAASQVPKGSPPSHFSLLPSSAIAREITLALTCWHQLVQGASWATFWDGALMWAVAVATEGGGEKGMEGGSRAPVIFAPLTPSYCTGWGWPESGERACLWLKRGWCGVRAHFV